MKIKKTNNIKGSDLKKPKKVALGKGLAALLPDIDPGTGEYFNCNIEMIHPNRYQPRIRFSEDELEELTRSIKEQGIIQPLAVRKDDKGYELIAGERRLRAARKAGLKKVPVIVKDINDTGLLEMSIVENVQREDLNPMEEADAYHRLINGLNLTQDQVAERVGKSRSAVANFLRLRQLPPQIKDSITDGILSMGHARALLGAQTSARQISAWRTVISKKLSVRETEKLIQQLSTQKKTSKTAQSDSKQRYFLNLADELSRNMGTKVRIKRSGQKGKVEISFFSDEDLDRLLKLFKKI